MKNSIPILLFVSLLLGCVKNPSGPAASSSPPPSSKAVYVLNEGGFADPFGARLSVYDLTTDSVYQDVVEAANAGSHLGNLGDDMAFYNGVAFILMSGSEDLVRLDLATNTIVPPVKNLSGSSPHDILLDPSRNKIFVTRLYRNSVYVLNLGTLAVVDSIPVGPNPQGMVIASNRLFVCNSGYGADNTVSVINADNDSVVATLRLSDGPTGIASANDGKVWVACTGNAFGAPATTGRIYVIDPVSLAKADSISFTENLWGNILFDNAGYAYVGGTTPSRYDGGPVHRIHPTTKAVTMNYIPGTYYAMGYDEVEDILYLSDANQFATVGSVTMVKQGVAGKTFAAGYGPGVIRFKR